MEARDSQKKPISQMEADLPVVSTAPPSGPEELSQEHFSSQRVLFFLVISIFLAEVVSMILVYKLPPLPYGNVTLLDAGIMTLLIFPLLYFLSFRPLIRHINKRRQAEKAIEEERQRFNHILEGLPAYVVLLTPDHQVSFANRVFCERFGISPGKRCYEHLFGRSQPCEICETYKVLNTGAPIRWQWTGPDGRIYDVFDYPFTEADGSTLILEMGIDITEQKRAEEQVHQMALFPALNPGATLRVDAAGRIDISNLAAQVMGFCVGAQLTEVMPDLKNLDLASCITTGATLQVQETYLAQQILQWTIRGVPEQGFAFLYSTDITLRKQAEDLNRQLSRVVEQTEDTVVVTNREGVIEYVNPAFERLTGYTKEEALGKTPRVIKSDIHEREFYQDMWTTILNGDIFQSEIANRRKNGELFYEVKTITPLRDAQGNITQFVSTGKDITRRKQDEAELLKAYDELELRVQKRTEELVVANAELLAEINERTKIQTALEQSRKELSVSEQRARHLIQYAPAAIYEMDFFGQRFLSVNDIACQWTGYTKEELLCMSPMDLVDPVSKVTFQERVRAKLSGQNMEESVEYKIIAKDGHEILAEMHVGAFTYKDGKPESVLVVAHDITERKRAEETLRAVNEELTRFNRAMIGRELRMIEMKKEVNELCESLGQPPRYSLDFDKR